MSAGHPANFVTACRIVLAIPVLWCLARGWTTSAVGFFLLAALTDALDGWVARRWGGPTRQGRLLDALADRLLILLTVAGLFLSARMSLLTTSAFLIWLAGELVAGLVISRSTGECYLFLEHRPSIRLAACCAYVLIGACIIECEWILLPLAATFGLLVYSAIDYSVWLRGQRLVETAQQP